MQRFPWPVRLTVVVGTLCAAVGVSVRDAGAAPGQAPPTAPSAVTVRTTIDRYCVTCHSDRLRTAGLSLQSADVGDVPRQAEVWEKVAGKLRSGAMPPAQAPRPEASDMRAIASWIELTLNEAARRNPNPGRPAIHRLNRSEYTNAIRDLLALDVDARQLLPADDQGFGFDNNADALGTSPGLMDRYLLAARKVARQALGDVTMRPMVETFSVSRLLTQSDRSSEYSPFGSRGGLTLRHTFPLDADYVLRIRLQGAALRSAEQVNVRLDGERIAQFATGQARVKAGGQSAEGAPDPFLETRFAAKAGPRALTVSLVKRRVAPEGVMPSQLPVGNISFRANGVSSIELEGPLNARGIGETPSRQRIFACRPTSPKDEISCAIRILSAVARRAYRRPATDRDVQTLLDFYKDGRAEGFDVGIRTALERILIDPEFLFRVERDPSTGTTGAAHPISDLELASRLSFFLWSSIPDDELLDVASSGRLRVPGVLTHQVQRMFADERSRTLVTNFAAQWLHLRNMRAVAPDLAEFPDFDDDLREAFQRETELFIESQLREDRSVVDLLSANYTFLNERLARHYGITGVYGSHFRRHTLDRPERVGLLGHGSVLTVTAYATRTSPVVRGKWLLENILGAPPPAPPPNVPALKDNEQGSTPRSVRERMEQHRANPVCASCHARMDPLGFALENFDAIGKWRDVGEDHRPIDAAGVLPDGSKFDGPADLRQLLLARRDEFANTVAEKLLIYALGRGVEYSDRPALRAIVRDAKAQGYTWSAIINGIVASPTFQMRQPTS
jgi:mono/diheme cytochrome c family protein